MALPDKAFGQWRLARSASNYTFLKEPTEEDGDKPPTTSKRLIAREDMTFEKSYDIVNQDDILLQGADLRRAVLDPVSKDEDGERTYKFITEPQFVKRGLRARCNLCLDHLSDRMRYHKDHFKCHPKTGFEFSTSSLFPEVDWDIVPEQLEQEHIRKVVQNAIKDPSAAFGDFKARAEAKKSRFAQWAEDAHAGYYGRTGFDLIADWIRRSFPSDLAGVDVAPLSVTEFLEYRLIPFTVDYLIADTLRITTKQARDLRTRSCHIGLLRDLDQPVDSDEEQEENEEDEEMDERDDGRNEADPGWMEAVRQDVAAERPLVLAEGREKGWPEKLDFAGEEYERFKSLLPKIKEGLAPPISLQLFDEVKEEYQKADRLSKADKNRLGIDNEHFGYYGVTGGDHIHKWISKHLSKPLKSLKPKDYPPFSKEAFKLRVLAPTIALWMIQDREKLSIEQAHTVWTQSRRWGEEMFDPERQSDADTEDDDEDEDLEEKDEDQEPNKDAGTGRATDVSMDTTVGSQHVIANAWKQEAD
ncbi:hypothetical protein OC846_006666 [Tilletia horrida]|uniref:Restriction of telomere capping protein 4 n=1 Tax=Tilletia horrida TaxID=155126 RepID=A0AAN6GJK9_9BASI|nr:hypothetical protein OC846_006666 [Tilletia horrida]KAK0559046.1 hypothetical protein OC861_006764 [Tilletia horrida]